MATKVAVVTGSNKGIGFSIVKKLLQTFKGVTYLTSRDDGRGQSAVAELNKLGLYPKYHQLDVTNRESVETFRDHIKETYGGIDYLVNNAAVADSVDLYNTDYEECKRIVNVNFYSILTIQEVLFPIVKENGRILNISSDCGHLSNVKNQYWREKLSNKNLTEEDVKEFVSWFLEAIKNKTFKSDDIADNSSIAAYRVAKVALSALTFVQQRELAAKNIAVNSLHPGFVRTDMTLGRGFFNVDEAAETPLYLLLEAPQELQGFYVWYNGRVLDWFNYDAEYYFKIKDFNKYD